MQSRATHGHYSRQHLFAMFPPWKRDGLRVGPRAAPSTCSHLVVSSNSATKSRNLGWQGAGLAPGVDERRNYYFYCCTAAPRSEGRCEAVLTQTLRLLVKSVCECVRVASA